MGHVLDVKRYSDNGAHRWLLRLLAVIAAPQPEPSLGLYGRNLPGTDTGNRPARDKTIVKKKGTRDVNTDETTGKFSSAPGGVVIGSTGKKRGMEKQRTVA